jgi:hypothetical protein
LLSAGAFSVTAADPGMGICLSAWASNDLASSLSFLSLAITRQAASCCPYMTDWTNHILDELNWQMHVRIYNLQAKQEKNRRIRNEASISKF